MSFQLQRVRFLRSCSAATRSVASIKLPVTQTASTGGRGVAVGGSTSSRAEINGDRRYWAEPTCNANSGFCEISACAHLRTGEVERRFFDSTTSFDSGKY